MPPRRPRRRARRRSPARPVTLLIAAVVVLAVVVGGLTQVSRQSQGYDANSDRDAGGPGHRCGRPVECNLRHGAQGRQRSADADPPGVAGHARRRGATDGPESARAQVAAGSTPLGTVATQFAAVFADRAQAMTQLRAAVYGYLGMQPIPPANAPAGDATAASGDHALLSATQATNRIAAAGALLTRSDALYRSVRRSLAAAPGHATAAAVGLGDRPAGVAARERGRPGRSRGHLAHAGGDALRRPAHRAPEPPRPADAARAPRRTCRSSARRPRSA